MDVSFPHLGIYIKVTETIPYKVVYEEDENIKILRRL